MTAKRKHHTAPFKAQVALAAIKGDRTINEYATEMVIPGGGPNKVKLPAEYKLLQIPPPAPKTPTEWKGTDIVATATLVQAIFATGGGNETGSALLYQSLVNRYGQ